MRFLQKALQFTYNGLEHVYIYAFFQQLRFWKGSGTFFKHKTLLFFFAVLVQNTSMKKLQKNM